MLAKEGRQKLQPLGEGIGSFPISLQAQQGISINSQTPSQVGQECLGIFLGQLSADVRRLFLWP